MRLSIVFLACMIGSAAFGQKTTVDMPPMNREEKKVQFFPNPATTFLTFEFRELPKRGSQIQVFSFLGRQVKTIQANAQKVTVNISDLSRGVYVFQVRDPNGRILESNKFQVAQ